MAGEGRLNPMGWFRRRGSNDSNATDIPDLPPTVKYNGDHHMSYNVSKTKFSRVGLLNAQF